MFCTNATESTGVAGAEVAVMTGACGRASWSRGNDTSPTCRPPAGEVTLNINNNNINNNNNTNNTTTTRSWNTGGLTTTSPRALGGPTGPGDVSNTLPRIPCTVEFVTNSCDDTHSETGSGLLRWFRNDVGSREFDEATGPCRFTNVVTNRSRKRAPVRAEARAFHSKQ
ncbi:hypothetical protein AAG570_004778 [Ranatra chinensis]|uniref:Uncharacterized protein n=1 Tax=Ranatra chinensis TaxID=642074 RepID=A0ABD0Y1V0_9HEMI